VEKSKKANTYYEDAYGSFGAFDYVLANPPFNVDDVRLSSVEKDKRFNTCGMPRKKSRTKKADAGKETVPNANYLWINLFATSLKSKGRAALVMANSASDARHSEADIRKTLIGKNVIYAMLTLPSNMFYTVTLPATLWFFDRAKTDHKILFIDARNIFTQIDRAHREFSNLRCRADVDPNRIGAWADHPAAISPRWPSHAHRNSSVPGVDLHGIHEWPRELNIPAGEPDYHLAVESSPMHDVDGWRSPVLLIRCDADPDVQVNRTVMLKDALRWQKTPFEIPRTRPRSNECTAVPPDCASGVPLVTGVLR
jgi:hypothetical protein